MCMSHTGSSANDNVRPHSGHHANRMSSRYNSAEYESDITGTSTKMVAVSVRNARLRLATAKRDGRCCHSTSSFGRHSRKSM